MSVERVQVRSYRTCFDLERRIHRIDRWRIPVPWGVPLRGVGYAAAALATLLSARGIPVAGDVVAALPAPVRLVVIPVGVAVALVRIRVDGRPAHAALWAMVRQGLASRLPACDRPAAPGTTVAFGDLALAPDCGGDRLRRARVVGPARVEVRAGVRRARRGRRVSITSARGSTATVVDLAAGEVLEVRP